MSAHTPVMKLSDSVGSIALAFDRHDSRREDVRLLALRVAALEVEAARAPDLLAEVAALRAELEQVKADALGAATFTRTVDGENAALRAKVEMVESAAMGWAKEANALRLRVEALTEHIEALLGICGSPNHPTVEKARTALEVKP